MPFAARPVPQDAAPAAACAIEAGRRHRRRRPRRWPSTPIRTRAAIAPALAAELYGLEILAARHRGRGAQHHPLHGADRRSATRRGRRPASPCVTSFTFRVRNLPAALYKALGGFATNGVNMTKLESYMENGAFTATFFYAEVDGRPEDPTLAARLRGAGLLLRPLRGAGRLSGRPVPLAGLTRPCRAPLTSLAADADAGADRLVAGDAGLDVRRAHPGDQQGGDRPGDRPGADRAGRAAARRSARSPTTTTT